jgi:hypothetical protein
MSLGLSTACEYTDSDLTRVIDALLAADYGRAEEYVPTMERALPRELEQICKTKQLSEERFIRSLAFPIPSHFQALIYSSELRKKYGDLSKVTGFSDEGIFTRPKGYGLLVPVRKNGEITELKFYPMREMLKAKEQV